MTPSQLALACASSVELGEVLEFDALEPPLTRRDLVQLCGDLLATLHNAHFTGPPQRAEDFYPELRPEDWEKRQRRRVQRESQQLRDAARLTVEDAGVKALKAALEARKNGQ